MVVASALVVHLKLKSAMLVHAVTLPGVDGVLAACKESDKFNSSSVVIGVKTNGPTEHVTALQPDTEEPTSTVWITTDSSQLHSSMRDLYKQDEDDLL